MSPQTAVSLGLMRAEEAPLLGKRLSGRVAQDEGYDPNLGHRQLRRSDGQQQHAQCFLTVEEIPRRTGGPLAGVLVNDASVGIRT